VNTAGQKLRCIEVPTSEWCNLPKGSPVPLKLHEVYEVESGNHMYVKLKGVVGVWRVQRFEKVE